MADNKSKTPPTRRRTRPKPKKPSDKKANEKQPRQSTLPEFFPATRSRSRIEDSKTKQRQANAERLKSQCEDGLEERVVSEEKGKGVFATKSFKAGDLVCEYSGDLIEKNEAEKREENYSRDSKHGCYMYYFKFKGKTMCVDATKDNGRKGRLLNHSRSKPNVYTKLMELDNKPHLVLLAKRNIEKGEELLYDYGDRAKRAIETFPWLAH